MPIPIKDVVDLLNRHAEVSCPELCLNFIAPFGNETVATAEVNVTTPVSFSRYEVMAGVKFQQLFKKRINEAIFANAEKLLDSEIK